ncbi:MAG: CHAT domain-containing protein [Cyanobacteria bacterium J06650_10]
MSTIMELTTGQILTRLKSTQRRGDYRAAADYGDTLSVEVHQLPQIAIALARLKMRQGYIAQAEALLENADQTTASSGEQLVLKMEWAALQMLRRGVVMPPVEMATASLEALSEAAAPSDVADARRIYCRVLFNAAIAREMDRDLVMAQAAELPEIAARLEAFELIDEGLSARFTYADNVLVGEARILALGELAERATAMGQPQMAGEAHVRRAERRLAAGEESDHILADLDKAAKRYAEVNHVIGPIDIRRVQAQLAIQRELAAPDEWIECLAQYREVDYLKGAISLLMDLSQLAHDSGNTALALDYRQQGLEAARATGMGMMEDNFQLALIDLLMRNNQYGAAIEVCEAAIESDLPRFNKGNYEQMLSTVYAFVRDFKRSRHHIRRAIAIFESVGAEGSATVAVTRLASDLDSLQTDNGWDEAEPLLETWIEKDLARADRSEAGQKQELLAQIYFRRYLFSARFQGQLPLLEKAEALLIAADESVLTLDKRVQAKRRGSIYQLRGQLREMRNDTAGSEQCWRQALALYEAAGMEMEAANSSYILGSLALNQANQQLLPHFGEAESLFNAALTFYDQSEMRRQAADTHFMLARLYTNAAQQIQLAVREQMIQAALDHLTAGEANYDAIRRDFYAGSALAAQASKQEIIRQSQRLYNLALEILLIVSPRMMAEGAPGVEMAWQWAQRAKARALNDSMGMAAVVPARILSQLQQYPTALALFEQEREIVALLAEVSAGEKAELRGRLAAVRDQMAEDEHLADYLDMRNGVAFDLTDVASTFSVEADRRCVCVDWVEVSGALWLFVMRPAGAIEVRQLGVRSQTVQTFVANNLGRESFRATLRDDPELLREMDGLVAPLAELTQAGELLILSLTGAMNALPLHALTVEEQCLIERNPVVYCPSLTVLRQCLARADVREVSRVALFGDPGGDRPAAAELVRELSERYDTPYLSQAQVTRLAFSEAIRDSDLIHFQGHAVHEPGDPLSSYLMLADGKLTARDIFGLVGLRADLVTLAACESAANVIEVGDDPLGLIPSFLFAGSQAVLASLWKVNSKVAAEFMRYFYAGIEGMQDSDDLPMNKAEAVRQAMLRVRESPRYEAPYYWAPFVLNGDWH